MSGLRTGLEENTTNDHYANTWNGLMCILIDEILSWVWYIYRAHHASPKSAALAASLQMSGFQDCLSFIGWHRSCVPS